MFGRYRCETVRLLGQDRPYRRSPPVKPASGDQGSASVATRPGENHQENDQKRIMTPEEAFRAGADYIVVGRPVSAAADPRAAAESIQQTIAGLFTQEHDPRS